MEEAKRIILAFGDVTPAFSQLELDQMWDVIEKQTHDQAPPTPLVARYNYPHRK